MDKQEIIDAIRKFVGKNLGQELTSLIAAVEWRDGLTAEDMGDSFKLVNIKGLKLTDKGAVRYPSRSVIVRRKIACLVLAQTLRDHWALDAPIGQDANDYIAEMAKLELGDMATNWFTNPQ